MNGLSSKKLGYLRAVEKFLVDLPLHIPPTPPLQPPHPKKPQPTKQKDLEILFIILNQMTDIQILLEVTKNFYQVTWSC